MQDMGAAGIICSTSEMSAKGEAGMRIDLDKVPRRQKNMLPWELLLSESQERMLIVCYQGREQEVIDIFDKWDLPCVEIGEVTDTGQLEFFFDGVKVADVNAESLVLGGGAPVYNRSFSRPVYMDRIAEYNIENISIPDDLVAVAQRMTALPNLLSKHWITTQYDSMVRTNSIDGGHFSDASVIRIKETKKGIAASTDCNATYVYADPYIGAQIVVFEAARNIVCTGGRPVAITNCLNFGNPYNPEVYYQFVKVIEGMGHACRILQTPVTGGNVSFYNQTVLDSGTEPVYPTPTIGMVGVIDDISLITNLNFKQEGDIILLLGKVVEDISSSEYLRNIHHVQYSPAPYFNEPEELLLQKSVSQLIQERLVNSVHDISEGGLFQCLLESGYHNNLGFQINLNESIRLDAQLFGEAQSRVVISVNPANIDTVKGLLNELEIEYAAIGLVSTNNIKVNNIDFGNLSIYKEVFYNRFKEIISN